MKRCLMANTYERRRFGVLDDKMALILFTILQCTCIVAFYISVIKIKKYSRLISRKDMSFSKRLKRAEIINKVSHFILAVVMVFKTDLENKIDYHEANEVLWMIDVVIMGISTISFVLRIYKYGWK